MSKVKDEKAKKDLIKYMEDHPNERLWQSIRNFQHYNFIYASNKLSDDPEFKDTFYWEDKEADE